jgi:anti-anti-sigma regulatory factor
MGCTSIVTGISPDISQALVNLGIDLGDIQTQATLKDGVGFSLANLGMKLHQINADA